MTLLLSVLYRSQAHVVIVFLFCEKLMGSTSFTLCSVNKSVRYHGNITTFGIIFYKSAILSFFYKSDLPYSWCRIRFFQTRAKFSLSHSSGTHFNFFFTRSAHYCGVHLLCTEHGKIRHIETQVYILCFKQYCIFSR